MTVEYLINHYQKKVKQSDFSIQVLDKMIAENLETEIYDSGYLTERRASTRSEKSLYINFINDLENLQNNQVTK